MTSWSPIGQSQKRLPVHQLKTRVMMGVEMKSNQHSVRGGTDKKIQWSQLSSWYWQGFRFKSRKNGSKGRKAHMTEQSWWRCGLVQLCFSKGLGKVLVAITWRECGPWGMVTPVQCAASPLGKIVCMWMVCAAKYAFLYTVKICHWSWFSKNWLVARQEE